MSTKLKIDNENAVLENVETGGDIIVRAADDAAGDGGAVVLEGGDGDGSGTGGAVFIRPGYGGGAAPSIPVGPGVPEPAEFWLVDGGATPGYVGFKAPDDVSAMTTGDGANTVWTLPEGDGAANEVMITDGSGILSWAALDSSLLTFPITGPDGLFSAPTYSFTSETGTGMYFVAGPRLAFAVGGGGKMSMTANAVEVAANIELLMSSLGVVGTPIISFTSDPDTGIYSPGADIFAITAGGVEGIRFTEVASAITIQLGGNLNVNDFDIVGKPGSTSAGGDVDIIAGAGSGGNFAGGDINLTAGSGSGTGAGGAIALQGGHNNDNGNGGGLTIYGGNGNSGGTIDINAGTGGTGTGGTLFLTGGSGNNVPSGGVFINGGAGGSGAGGDIVLTGGNSSTTRGVVRINKGGTTEPGEIRIEDDTGGQYLGLTVPGTIVNSKTYEMAPKVVTVAVAGPTTINEDEDVILVDPLTAAAPVVLTLHAAANERFRYLNIKVISQDPANTVTVNAGGGDTIDGAGSLVIPVNSQWTNYTLVNDKGTGWYII